MLDEPLMLWVKLPDVKTSSTTAGLPQVWRMRLQVSQNLTTALISISSNINLGRCFMPEKICKQLIVTGYVKQKNRHTPCRAFGRRAWALFPNRGCQLSLAFLGAIIFVNNYHSNNTGQTWFLSSFQLQTSLHQITGACRLKALAHTSNSQSFWCCKLNRLSHRNALHRSVTLVKRYLFSTHMYFKCKTLW